jgi:hypothetical protein
MCRDPIRQLLAPHRLDVGEARRAQDGDKNLYRNDLAGKAINDLAGAAGEVDKQLLARDMGLAHRRFQPACPGAVQVAEPGIAEAVRRAGAVLLPQQRQRHIGTAQLAMHPGPIGHWALIRRDVRRRWEQHRLQLHVVEIVRQRPDDASSARSAQIPAYRSLAQPQALGDRPLRQLARMPQPQNFSDLAHRQSLGWHPIPRCWAKGQAYLRLRTAGDADRYTPTSV